MRDAVAPSDAVDLTPVGSRDGRTEPPVLTWEHISQRKKGQTGVGIYFLSLVVLLAFIYLFYALFRPEKF